MEILYYMLNVKNFRLYYSINGAFYASSLTPYGA